MKSVIAAAAVCLPLGGILVPGNAAAADTQSPGSFKDCSQKCVSVGVMNHGESIMIMQRESLAQQYLSRPRQVIGKSGDDVTSDFWTAPVTDGVPRETVYVFGSNNPLLVHFATTVNGDTSTSACYFTQLGSEERIAPSDATCRAVSGSSHNNPDVTQVYYSINGK
ncbi:hypothetical protein [Streptomyces sp. NPDC001774]